MTFDGDHYDFALLQQKAELVTRSDIEARIWIRDLRAGEEDAWVGLLLTLLPSLARLDIKTERRINITFTYSHELQTVTLVQPES
jgi:hypothetical protein